MDDTATCPRCGKESDLCGCSYVLPPCPHCLHAPCECPTAAAAGKIFSAVAMAASAAAVVFGGTRLFAIASLPSNAPDVVRDDLIAVAIYSIVAGSFAMSSACAIYHFLDVSQARVRADLRAIAKERQRIDRLPVLDPTADDATP